jgi:hypothetical protein
MPFGERFDHSSRKVWLNCSLDPEPDIAGERELDHTRNDWHCGLGA